MATYIAGVLKVSNMIYDNEKHRNDHDKSCLLFRRTLFAHYLGHFLTVSLRVEGSLGQEDGVFLGGDAELIVKGVVPDLLHVIPVGDDTVFDGVLHGQDTTLGLGFIADVRIFLAHADHDALYELERNRTID